MSQRRLMVTFFFLFGALMNVATGQAKPTIVLVYGAFADSSRWNGVVAELLADGYPVIAAANPLRSLKMDADYVASVITDIKGPCL